MNNSLEEIGKRLSERRRKVGLSQEELGERAGVTGQTISYAELGKKAMRTDTLLRICEVLEVSPDYLLLGQISTDHASHLLKRMESLTPGQFSDLENIIELFIQAVQRKD